MVVSSYAEKDGEGADLFETARSNSSHYMSCNRTTVTCCPPPAPGCHLRRSAPSGRRRRRRRRRRPPRSHAWKTSRRKLFFYLQTRTRHSPQLTPRETHSVSSCTYVQSYLRLHADSLVRRNTNEWGMGTLEPILLTDTTALRIVRWSVLSY